MYARLFRLLPGPLWFRVLLVALLIVVIVAVLFEIVFPWLVQYSPWGTEGTVTSTG